MGIIIVAAPSILLSLAGVSAADWAAEDTDGEWVPEATLPQVCPSHWEAAAAAGSQESALPAGEGGKTGPSEANHFIFLLVADNLLTVNDSTATCVFTFVSHLLSLLCPHQARQDILAQDLAEAIDSQVELAEHLRCYREENEKLHTEKQGVCMCVFLCFNHGSGIAMQIQQNIYDGKCHLNIPLLHSIMTCKGLSPEGFFFFFFLVKAIFWTLYPLRENNVHVWLSSAFTCPTNPVHV